VPDNPKDLMKMFSLLNHYGSSRSISIYPTYRYNYKATKEDEMMNWDGYGTTWWGGGMMFMGLFWILLIGLSIWLISWITQRGAPAEKIESPRQVLDRRLASGEIKVTEYAQMRRLIDGRANENLESDS